MQVGSGGRAVKRRTVNRVEGGSIPPTAVSKLRQFLSPHICGRYTKIGGPFYLVSMPGEVKVPTLICSGLTNSRWTLNALQRAFFLQYIGERKRERTRIRQFICDLLRIVAVVIITTAITTVTVVTITRIVAAPTQPSRPSHLSLPSQYRQSSLPASSAFNAATLSSPGKPP